MRVMIIGRPSEYAEERAEQLCSRIAEGERLRSICSAEDMPDKDIPPLSTDRRTSFIRNPSTTLVGGSAPRSAGDNGDIRLFFT
jgi:Bacteriophage Sf6, terminase small subunit-like